MSAQWLRHRHFAIAVMPDHMPKLSLLLNMWRELLPLLSRKTLLKLLITFMGEQRHPNDRLPDRHHVEARQRLAQLMARFGVPEAREDGIMGEILEENLWRNKEGNPVMFDLVLLDLARSQPDLTLLLNTAVYQLEKEGQWITQLKAFNAINETFYQISAPQFCDATGDGVLGYLAGAEFREGAEDEAELGEFPEAANMTIEWVGTIPGKRESRRFMGDHLLSQQDIVEQRDHYDAVGYGGWSIDLHPADGVYSTHDGCRQFHSKGTYTIPWRSLYSRSVENLLLTGRLISASHVTFGSARVMCTCGLLGEVVGRGAAVCHEQRISPKALANQERIGELQQRLQAAGCYIPRQRLHDPSRGAHISVSSELQLSELPANGQWHPLTERCRPPAERASSPGTTDPCLGACPHR